MKVAFLCSSFSWGGLEINNLKLCSWLVQRGQDLVLLCPKNSRLAQEAAVEKIPTIEFDHRSKHLPLSAAFKLSRILFQQQINILIIAHYRQHYLGVWTKLLSTNLRLVYWQQMQVVLNRKDFYHSYFYKKLDAWISPLHFLKRQLLNNTVLKETKIHVIPLGIDLNRFRGVSQKRLEARKLFEIPPDEFLVGLVGRYDQQKGQETLLRALKNLKDRGMPVKGILIGEASYGREDYLTYLHGLSKDLKIEKEIYFKPFMKEVALAYACMDIFIMASFSETMGMVTVEAMAAGVPIIGTNSGGTPELLDNGQAGLLFEPGQGEQLADKIIMLYENPARRLEFVHNASQRIELYSHERQCQLFEDLITSL